MRVAAGQDQVEGQSIDEKKIVAPSYVVISPPGRNILLNNCPFVEGCEGLVSNYGAVVHQSIQCNGVKAELVINEEWGSFPTLYVNGFSIEMSHGPSYLGPKCLVKNGKHYVAFIESMGNSYETYRLIDIDTFEISEIDTLLAIKLGFWK